MPSLSPDAQAALAVARSCLASLKIGGEQGRAQFVSTLHPEGRMSHARYHLDKAVFFHNFPDELAEYVAPAWKGSGMMEEDINGEPIVLIDHDLAMIWTPFWVRKDSVLLHVGTNCFNLLKITQGDGTAPPKGEWGSDECNWAWKITVLNDTARAATPAEKERLDKEYAERRL